MEAKVVNTSLLGYQSAAREEDRESEGGRERERERERESVCEADFPQTHCKVGINSAIARAAPPLKHREGRSVRGERSEAGEAAQDRRDGGGGGVRGRGVVGVSTATCVRLELLGCARLSWECGGGWGGGEGREGGGGGRGGVSRALRGAVLPRSAQRLTDRHTDKPPRCLFLG